MTAKHLAQHKIKYLLAALVAIALLLTAELAAAEQFIEDKDYIIHYSAFTSTLIKPEVAKAYGLTRSRQRGLVNISVQRKMPEGLPKAVTSKLKGFTGQLGGSEIPLKFKLITEGDAIYYLAEFLVRDGDKMNFDINVQPTPDHAPMKLSFSQAFFSE